MRAAASASRARAPTAAMAIPGEAMNAFCDALTTRSTPQRVHVERHRPQAADAVDQGERFARRARTAAASSRSGLATPVEVSLWVRSTAAYGARPPGEQPGRAGSAAVPQSKSSRSTAAPKISAIFANRSPNARSTRPAPGRRARGRSRSPPPVSPCPEPVRRNTSPSVPISPARPSVVSRRSSPNSARGG